jgi:hypothetical protein
VSKKRDIYQRMRDGDADPGMYPEIAEAVGMHGGPACYDRQEQEQEQEDGEPRNE